MNTRKTMVVISLILLLFSLNLSAKEKLHKIEKEKIEISLQEKGEVLVRTLWKNMKHSNIKTIHESTAECFQSLHQDGVRDREQELQLISKLDLSEYQLSDFTITNSDDLIIVSYNVTVAETIEGKRIEKQKTPRTSIFQKIEGEWKWVYHINPVKFD